MSLKKWLNNQAYGTDSRSINIRMRKKRMKEFELFFGKTFEERIKSKERISILDMGGTYRYWKSVGFKYADLCDITLLNLMMEKIPDNEMHFHSVTGDATNLEEYSNKSYDLVFSNSVIEHVGDFENQRSMANEMMRVGKHIYLQTPNYWFPYEPHYNLPIVHWLPITMRAWIGYKWNMGYLRDLSGFDEAIEVAENIVLLKRSEVERLFPGIKVRKEKFGLLTKSFYLYK